MAPVIATDAAANGVVKPKPENQPSCAYVTFLAGNGDYVKGVVGQAKGLRKAKSKGRVQMAKVRARGLAKRGRKSSRPLAARASVRDSRVPIAQYNTAMKYH